MENNSSICCFSYYFPILSQLKTLFFRDNSLSVPLSGKCTLVAFQLYLLVGNLGKGLWFLVNCIYPEIQQD